MSLHFTLVDEMYDHIPETEHDWFEANVERPVLERLCELEGHEVVNDQCGKPEHRYCVKCNRGQPNAEVAT